MARYRYKKRKYNERSVLSGISYFIRQLFFPNPFSNLFSNPCQAEIINYLFGGVIVFLAYLLTGVWYDRKNRIIGCIGFFINFALLTELLLLITKYVSNVYIVAFLFFVSYLLLCFVEYIIIVVDNN